MCCLSFPDYLRIMSQVLLQTYIESLRARIGQTFSVNHHGGVKTIKGDREKVRHRETISLQIHCNVFRKTDLSSFNQQIRSCKTVIKSLQLFWT